mgnify:CR=1 FL=1
MFIIITIFLIINMLSFLVMGYDKRKARQGGQRVAENTLLALALLGGASGIYGGMHVFRHKTLHPKFTYGIPLCIVINLFTYGLISQLIKFL